MSILLRLSAVFEWPCKMVARLVGWLLMVLMAVIIYDVVGRRFFSTVSFKLQELEWHLHGAIAVLSFGWAYIKNAHVRIDLFSAHMRSETRLRIEILAICLFLLPFMALLLWYGIDFAHRSYIRNESSPGGVGLTNRWIIKSAIPLSALLTISAGLSVLMRAIVALRRPDLLSDPWNMPDA